MNILVNREETIHQHSVGRNETSPSQTFDFHETNFNVAIRPLSRGFHWNITYQNITDINSYMKFEAYIIDWHTSKNALKMERIDLKMRGCTLQD